MKFFAKSNLSKLINLAFIIFNISLTVWHFHEFHVASGLSLAPAFPGLLLWALLIPAVPAAVFTIFQFVCLFVPVGLGYAVIPANALFWILDGGLDFMMDVSPGVIANIVMIAIPTILTIAYFYFFYLNRRNEAKK